SIIFRCCCHSTVKLRRFAHCIIDFFNRNNTIFDMNFEHIKTLETPAYYYDLGLLRRTLLQARQQADAHNYKIHYAIKANNNPRILKAVQESGLGADCVSGGEIEWAMTYGFNSQHVFFAGV